MLKNNQMLMHCGLPVPVTAYTIKTYYTCISVVIRSYDRNHIPKQISKDMRQAAETTHYLSLNLKLKYF